MINVVYSTEHWIVPIIVICILAVLLVAMIVTEGIARTKAGGSFIAKPGRFFNKDADYVKLFGTLILFAAYIVCLNILGFTASSIIFVFLFNLLYAGLEKKSVIISIIIAVVASLIISVVFGVIFNITLPGGRLSLVFLDLGFTLY